MDRNGVWIFTEGSGRQGMVERYCFNVICGAPTTFEVKGLRWDDSALCKCPLNTLWLFDFIFQQIAFIQHFSRHRLQGIFSWYLGSRHIISPLIVALNNPMSKYRSHEHLSVWWKMANYIQHPDTIISCIPDKVSRNFHQWWQTLSYISLSDPWDR